MLKDYTVTREFKPEEVIPAATLADLGEEAMKKEFARFVKLGSGRYTVDGWVVSVTMNTDSSEETARELMNQGLESLAKAALAHFE